jgi:hypothetical protein
MDNVKLPQELAKALVASIAAFLLGLLLKALGAGRWTIATLGGAGGGIAAAALVA